MKQDLGGGGSEHEVAPFVHEPSGIKQKGIVAAIILI
jgi:hypothetical protein